MEKHIECINTEKTKKQNVAERVARLGIFVALAMIFSYVEVLIPFSIGIPGVKLGIANLVVVVGLFLFQKREVFVISMIRILLMGLMFGNGASLLYSFAGGILSFLIMILAIKVTKLSIVGISILGAVFHNVGQILAAAFILDNIRITFYFPVLLIAGLITGMLIGIGSNQILKRIEKIKGMTSF